MDVVAEILKLAIVGLIAGFFSSWLANRDHRRRRWWELRVDAYQNAIGALSDLLYYYDKHYDAEISSYTFPEDFKEKLEQHWQDAQPKIRKLADSGAFLFSDRANAALREFMKDEHADIFIEHVDNKLGQAKRCLSELVECSKKDLKLS